MIKSKSDAVDPTYTIIIAATGSNGVTTKVNKREMFTKWFDVDGQLVSEPLTTWLQLCVKEAEGSIVKKKI